MWHFRFYVGIFCCIFFIQEVWTQNNTELDSIALDEFIFVDRKIVQSDKISFSNKDFKKLPASFDDPSRLLMHYAGFSASGDQANGIIYHGLPSHFFGWQLNGLDIVNPNHLANAGTASDLGAQSQGGVNLFSGNVINSYQFYSPTATQLISPYLGGVSNLQIDSVQNSYVQMSLLGFESGLQLKKKNMTFFANGRYSFTGLLSDFGAKFGGEDIRFADLVGGLNFTTKHSSTQVLVALGRSSNIHLPIEGTATSIKDSLNIHYRSKFSAFHLNHKHRLKNNISIHLGAAYSFRDDDRTLEGPVFFNAQNRYVAKDDYLNKDSKLTVDIGLDYKGYRIGMKSIHSQNDLDFNINKLNFISASDKMEFIPYILKKYTYKNLYVDAYLGGFFQGITMSPKFAGKVGMRNRIFDISYSISHTMQNASYQYFESELSYFYCPSINNLIDLNVKLSSKLSLSTQLFHHNVQNLIVGESSIIKNYTLLSGFDPFLKSNDLSTLTFNVYGTSLSLQYFSKTFWANTNTTLFDANLQTETSFKYSANINIGKDFLLRKNKKLSISISTHFRGKQPNYAIAPDNYVPIKRYDIPPVLFTSPYFRMDLRINYQLGKSFWSLDIQNVTSHLNHTFLMNEVDGVKPAGGLGLLPVLTYRRAF